MAETVPAAQAAQAARITPPSEYVAPRLPRWLTGALAVYGLVVAAAIVVTTLFPVVIDVSPYIVHIGSWALRWYSLMIMAGVMTGVWLSAKLGAQRGIAEDDTYSAAFWIVGAGIVGARIAHVIDEWPTYSQNPLLIPAVWTGGIGIWGGLVAGAFAGWLYTRRYGIPFWKFADSVSHGTLLGLAIGRFGCIVNGDVAGRLTNGDFGFIYVNPEALLPSRHPEYFNQATFPYPLYEMGLDLLLFGLLFWVARRARLDGAVFLVACVGYSLIRFFLTFTREQADFLFGLQEAQVFSIVSILVAAYMYFYLRDRTRAAARTRATARATAARA
jgi:phosphatidylglycerol:prolipoprotein diacylglycerol transferase